MVLDGFGWSINGYGWFLLKENPMKIDWDAWYSWMVLDGKIHLWFWMVLDGPSMVMDGFCWRKIRWKLIGMHDIAEWFWMGKSIYGFGWSINGYGWFLLKENPMKIDWDAWYSWMVLDGKIHLWFWMVLDGPSMVMDGFCWRKILWKLIGMHDIAEWFWMGKSIYGFGWFLLKDNPIWNYGFWMRYLLMVYPRFIKENQWLWTLDGPSMVLDGL